MFKEMSPGMVLRTAVLTLRRYSRRISVVSSRPSSLYNGENKRNWEAAQHESTCHESARPWERDGEKEEERAKGEEEEK